MKKCARCNQDKPVQDFYVSKAGKPNSYCKSCSSAQSTEWYLANKQRKAEINKAWRSKNVERRKLMNRASQALYMAIKAGKVSKGTECCACGSTEKIEGAHFDYTQLLNVIWMCSSCHKIWDHIRAKTQIG